VTVCQGKIYPYSVVLNRRFKPFDNSSLLNQTKHQGNEWGIPMTPCFKFKRENIPEKNTHNLHFLHLMKYMLLKGAILV